MAAEKRTGDQTTTRFSSRLLIAIVVLSAIVSPIGTALTNAESTSIYSQVQNNTTVQHENPQAVDEEGNLSELEGVLASRLSESLIDCTEGLKVGRYNACNRSNEEYPDWLSKYVNVTRETDSEENNTDSFDEANENQNDYASNVSRFRSTLSKYRAARQNGSTNRARTLAHRLQRIASNVNETSGELTDNYQVIGNGTGQNFTGAINTTTTITRNVTETAATVETDQFVNTTLTANTAMRRISFRRPLQVSGTLTAANGTELENRRIQLKAGNRIQTTRTDETGAFSLTHRPTVLPLDTNRITVQYVPSDLSVYRANESTVPVRVEQVDPALTILRKPTEIGYNETLVVSGRVDVNETGAQSVPVSVTIAGQSIVPEDQTLRTGTDGRFVLATQLPAEIPTGQQRLQVSLPLAQRALNQTSATETTAIIGTPTNLTVNGSQTSVNGSAFDGPEIHVAGRLTADNGTAVPNESVAIQLNGTEVNEIRTNANGRYEANVTVPEELFADRSGSMPLSLTAVYANKQSNLESSRSSTRLSIVLPEQSGTDVSDQVKDFFGFLSPAIWAIIIAGVVLSGVLAVLYRRRSESEPDEPADAPPTATPEPAGDENTESDSPLATAREQLFAGNMAYAVAAAYADAREKLGTELAITSPYTHWEFFDACQQRDLDHDQLEAFERLTELYEHAAFSMDTPSENTAATAIENAEVVTESMNTATDGGQGPSSKDSSRD